MLFVARRMSLYTTQPVTAVAPSWDAATSNDEARSNSAGSAGRRGEKGKKDSNGLSKYLLTLYDRPAENAMATAREGPGFVIAHFAYSIPQATKGHSQHTRMYKT